MSDGASRDGGRDAAVVGGGIAGAAACLRLAALGRRVLWIAPPLEEGDRPGEQLAPAARALLARLGAAGLLEAPGHRPANRQLSAWGSAQLAERDAIVHLEGPGTVLDRPAFERDLAALARAAEGVERVEAALAGAERGPEGWRLSLAGGEALPPVPFVIDASGRAAVVAAPLSQRFRADRLAALVAFLPQDPESEVAPTRATLIEAVADGWWYASLLADGRLALNYYSDPDLLPREASRDPAVLQGLLAGTASVGRWIDEAGFHLAGPPRLASAGTTWLAPVAGPEAAGGREGAGWAAVGDAAAAFDPLSSHGMTTALWSGIQAAEAADAWLAGDAEPLARYAAAVAEGVVDFLKARSRIYGMERRFAGRTFWQRRAG